MFYKTLIDAYRGMKFCTRLYHSLHPKLCTSFINQESRMSPKTTWRMISRHIKCKKNPLIFVHIFLQPILWQSGKIGQLNFNKILFCVSWANILYQYYSVFLEYFVLGKVRSIPNTHTPKKTEMLYWVNSYSSQPSAQIFACFLILALSMF